MDVNTVYQPDLTALEAAVRSRCTIRGSFTLRSGKSSDRYFDKYRFESDPLLLRSIAAALCAKTLPPFDALGGMDLGGVPIATAMALASDRPMCFVRKEAKTYGTCKQVEGLDTTGKRILLVEDVITTGSQLIDVVDQVRREGAIVEDVVCVLIRDDAAIENLRAVGLTLHYLFKGV